MAHPIPIGAPSLARLLLALPLLIAVSCGGNDPPAPAPTDATLDSLARDAPVTGPGDAGSELVPVTPGDSGAVVDGAAPAADGPASDGLVTDQAVAETGAGCQLCASWGPAESVGRIAAAGLANLSGMAASWRNPGIIYVHNDRNVPRFYALGADGALVGRFDLEGAAVLDLEDMAVSRCAPGAPGSCIYLADIGNNVTARSEFPIYRAVEPAISPGGGGAAVSLPAERFTFSYADGPHNAESLLVDPATATVYVITKEAAGVRSSAYRLTTFEPGRTNLAVKVQELPVPASDDQPATASSAHPCAAAFLLRTGNRLYEFRAPAGAALAAAFAVPPVSIPVGPDPQGEAVTYAFDGRATYTTGEGAAVPLHRSLCR